MVLHCHVAMELGKEEGSGASTSRDGEGERKWISAKKGAAAKKGRGRESQGGRRGRGGDEEGERMRIPTKKGQRQWRYCASTSQNSGK
jgi:hypothetical protein